MKKFRNNELRRIYVFILVVLAISVGIVYLFPSKYDIDLSVANTIDSDKLKVVPKLDKAEYNRRLLDISHIPYGSTTAEFLSGATTTLLVSSSTQDIWPAKIAYPNPGALLPFNRIVAYYGNFYSKGMGVLGQYPEDIMLNKLKTEVEQWRKADPNTPVVPAIDYIATTAQLSAGSDGKYRLRMPESQVDYAVKIANDIDGIVILDIQVGLSTLEQELPQYEKYFSMPNVHLAIDPEFSMKFGDRPGKVIGTFDASDINFAIDYLAALVKKHSLPPKILVIHRFTKDMVTNYKAIKIVPEVQVVMDMDGWGSPAKKKGTYQHIIYPEPVQFTGFKLFYKNDLLPPSDRMLDYDEVISLTPSPLFIQYQ